MENSASTVPAMNENAACNHSSPSAEIPVWQAWLQRLGFMATPLSTYDGTISRGQARSFQYLQWLFGLVWLYDAWTASSTATRHALAAFLGRPFSSVWVHLAGAGILLLDLYIALALLLDKSMRAVVWVGTVYLLFFWIVVEHGGDFDPLTGGTDIGLGPAYILMLIFVCAGWHIRTARTADGASAAAGFYWARAARVLFGFVWAWDAMYKLRPHFLTHFTSYLIGPDAMSGVGVSGMAGMATSGQPAWVVAWLHGWVAFIHATSPLAFSIASVVVEVAVACGLLTGRGLRVVLPLGLIFSLLIWVTAEGFGGPYGMGTTGMPGDMFGTAIIYAFLFAGLMVLHRWPCLQGDGA